MTQPKPKTDNTVETSASGGSLMLAAILTATLLAVRVSGYAALPYIVIFAPLLTLAAVAVVTLVLIILVLAIGGIRNG